MSRFLVFFFLLLTIFIVPSRVFAYSIPEDLLKLEEAPPVDTRVIYKLQLDPKLSKEAKASMLSFWGGASTYRICAHLIPDERLVYLVSLKGFNESSMVAELSSTRTFGSKFSVIDSESLLIKGPYPVDSLSLKSKYISTIMGSLRSKGLVK